MRPVKRGASPQTGDFKNYRDAYADLLSRLGPYCSYCERRIATQLAVEHIRPKGLPAYEHLIGRWDNFLLACVNCNSTKGDKDVVLGDVLLPDRDNTSAAYEYPKDGRVVVRDDLTAEQRQAAVETLSLTGLDQRASQVTDANGQLVAIDRVAQRMEIWLIAQESRLDLQANPSDAFRQQVARTAVGHGLFSIWMTVFEDDIAMRKLLIDAFSGSAADCFDSNTTKPVSPRPATGLADGSKI